MTERDLLERLRELRAEHEPAICEERRREERFHALRIEMETLVGEVQVHVQKHPLNAGAPRFDHAREKAATAARRALDEYLATWRDV